MEFGRKFRRALWRRRSRRRIARLEPQGFSQCVSFVIRLSCNIILLFIEKNQIFIWWNFILFLPFSHDFKLGHGRIRPGTTWWCFLKGFRLASHTKIHTLIHSLYTWSGFGLVEAPLGEQRLLARLRVGEAQVTCLLLIVEPLCESLVTKSYKG